MKKNRMMRLASVLLVLVLLTTSVISGTFAKYVTTVSNEDSARVARWGFTGENADIAITDLFTTAYDSTTDASVSSDVDVIAPGTGNHASFTFTFNGGGTGAVPDGETGTDVTAPEVKYKLTVSTAGSVCDSYIKANKNIKWAVCTYKDYSDNNNAVLDSEYGTWDAMITEIQGLAGAENNAATPAADGLSASATYNPGKLPYISSSYIIAWKWDFDTNGDTAVTDITEYDGKTQNQYDTMMGNMAVLDDVSISISVTAEQLD